MCMCDCCDDCEFEVGVVGLCFVDVLECLEYVWCEFGWDIGVVVFDV